MRHSYQTWQGGWRSASGSKYEGASFKRFVFLVGTDHLHLDGITARQATLTDVDHSGGANDLVIRLSNGSVTLLNTGAVANWETQLFI
jgi:hypothetical protein